MKTLNIKPETALIVAGVAVGGFLLWQAAKAVPQAVEATADLAGGLLTGNNKITESARTDAYKNAGIVGTLGATADNIAGGSLSKLGEWLGGKVYDLTH